MGPQVDIWDRELEQTEAVLRKLAPWPQNVVLPNGLQTAPERGGEDARQVDAILRVFPDLAGVRVLDLACRSGALAFALAQQGAHVMGVDPDARYVKQARWLRGRLGQQRSVRLRQAPVYAVARMKETFDMVLLMDGFRRIRYASLAFDLALERARQWVLMPADDAGLPKDQGAWDPRGHETRAELQRPMRDVQVWKVVREASDDELRWATGRPARAGEG